jgi:hypothetical protein
MGPEAAEQTALFTWIDATQHLGGCELLGLAFHVPNGELRNVIVAKRLKGMGVRAGVPDIWLPVPVAPYCGLVAEMKSAKGRTSPDQAAWFDALRCLGWRTSVWRSWQEGAWDLAGYLALPPEATRWLPR